MDITVKTAYDRLLSACESIEALQQEKKTAPARKTLAGDIYAFICYISKESPEERYDYFNKVYQTLEPDPMNNFLRVILFPFTVS